MNTPTPAREIDRLIDRLAYALNTDAPLDEAALGQAEWQAKKCQRTDPQEAHLALGMLAGLRQDRAAADQHFQEALRRGWRPMLALNYAAVLHRVYRPEDALEQFRQVIQAGPGRYFITAVERAIQCAYEAGRFHVASELMTLLRRHSDGPYTAMTNAITAGLPALVQAADALALTDEAMAAATDQAWAVISRLNKRMSVEIDDFIGDDGALFLSRTLLLSVPFEEARRMDLALMALQAETDVPLSTFCISVRDRPAA
ncbi:MAG: hypothetical protein WAT67_11710 [Candidatus Contendobacter sp.]